MVGMDIDELRLCCVVLVGMLTTSGLSVSGGRKAYKFLRNSANGLGYGSMTDPASGYVRLTAIMSGHMIL